MFEESFLHSKADFGDLDSISLKVQFLSLLNLVQDKFYCIEHVKRYWGNWF